MFLNAHVFLLGIVFRHRAFLAPSLTSPHLLKTLNIHPNETELQLPLRTELDKVFIFRRAVQMLTGYVISDNKPISYGMIAGWTKRCGELLGLAYGTIPYNLRYNAANQWTASGLSLSPLRTYHANPIQSTSVTISGTSPWITPTRFLCVSTTWGTRSIETLVVSSGEPGHSMRSFNSLAAWATP